MRNSGKVSQLLWQIRSQWRSRLSNGSGWFSRHLPTKIYFCMIAAGEFRHRIKVLVLYTALERWNQMYLERSQDQRGVSPKVSDCWFVLRSLDWILRDCFRTFWSDFCFLDSISESHAWFVVVVSSRSPVSLGLVVHLIYLVHSVHFCLYFGRTCYTWEQDPKIVPLCKFMWW